MDALLLDLKYSLRSLWRDKGFVATVVLTFSVCIAANTALFAIVNGVILRPLPVPDANSILITSNEYPKAGAVGGNYSASGDYFDRLREMTAFQSQALFHDRNLTIELNGTPQQVHAMLVTPSWFKLIRVPPAFGRAFTEEEGEIGRDQVVVLSYGLWQQLYGGDKAALGRTLRISGKPFSIVGVMPPNFNFIDAEVRLWMPLAFTPEEKTVHHSNNWYHIGRLKPGATLQQAQAQVDALNNENLERFPEWKEVVINAGFNTKVKPLQDMLTAGVKRTLYLLWGGAFLVLLIGAMNIANLALARLALRRREIATRVALGARRGHVIRQLLVENTGLALLGGIAGLALGVGVLRALSVLGLKNFPRAAEVHVDATVVFVSLALALVAGLVLGLSPFAAISGLGIHEALREGNRSGTSGGKARTVRKVLVGAQTGFAFALLTGAGLLLASFRVLLHIDPGFNANGVLSASVVLPESRYPNVESRRDFMNRALAAIRTIPGVSDAGATKAIPLGGNHNDNVILAEGNQMKPGESLISPLSIEVTPGYFEALGISILRGRDFTDRDNETAPKVIIIDERLARHFWPNSDPVGRRMYYPNNPKELQGKSDEHTEWMTVVGVARTLRYENLDDTGAIVGACYLPNSQRPTDSFTLALKSSADPGSTLRALRNQIARLDPELALFDAHSMSERIDLSLASRRTSMLLANAFGAVALFLASLGIYGVLAYLVAQRTREIGIRIALGSTRLGILQLVLREGSRLVGIGFVLGIIAAASLRKAIATELYGVQPFDVRVLVAVMALLATIALLACAIPARRAVRVDPIVALRYE
jgi:predicted permease